MPTITINYKTVKSRLPGVSDKQLKERISMLGTDLEEFSKQGITVEVFPNRPDMLSEFGFIRAMRAFVGLEQGLRQYKAQPSGRKVIIDSSVSSVRPFTACAIVKNLKLDAERIEQLIQLQEKLHLTYCRNRRKGAIGIYPSDKLKYPITFFAEDPRKLSFVPLGATRKMSGLQVLKLHEKGKEFSALLKDMKRFPFFRDAKGRIMSMPPIINSEFTGKVTPGTKEVFVECSGFDLQFLKRLLNIILCEMADMGGTLYSVVLEYPSGREVTPQLEPERIKLEEGYVYQMLGQKVNIKTDLGRMGYGYSQGTVLVPPYRVDVLHPIDLVEDIAIGHGYENFVPELPNLSTIGNEERIERLKSKLAELLVGAGTVECFTFNISSPRVQNEFMGITEPIIEFSNSKSSEQSGLRRSIIPGLLEVLQANANNEYPQRIFDMGTVFAGDKHQETGVLEQEFLGVALCGKSEDFTRAKQLLEYGLKAFGFEPGFREAASPAFIPGRYGVVLLKGKPIGTIGEIHPRTLNNFKLEMPVAVFELNLSKLVELV